MGCASSKNRPLKASVATTHESEQTEATCMGSELTLGLKPEESSPSSLSSPSPSSSSSSSRSSPLPSSSRSKSSRIVPTNDSGKNSGKNSGSPGITPKPMNDKSLQQEHKAPVSSRSNSDRRRRGTTAKTHGGVESPSPTLDNHSGHSHHSRSRSERSAVVFANDPDSLEAALNELDLDDFSNHTSKSMSQHGDSMVISIVRSDKLAFSGTGIRRHSRRKRNRQLGKDNTKIVLLKQTSPMNNNNNNNNKQAFEAETSVNHHNQKKLEGNKPTRSRTSRDPHAKTAGAESTAASPTAPANRRRRTYGLPDGMPVRSNSIVRMPSSNETSLVMMFEDKSEDLDLWPLPIDAIQ